MKTLDVARVPARQVAPPRKRWTPGPMSRTARRVQGWLPAGRPLSDERWEARHRGIAILLWLHVPALFVMGLLTHHSWAHSLVDVTPIVACGVVALGSHLSRHLRSGVTTLGLVVCSAVLVHLSGGNVEMHFHFFVVVGVITLYQDWVPFGLAITFVVIHHGVLGVLIPSAVYNHHAAQRQPWLWAGIHGAFVLAASVAHILAWRLNEDQALRDELTRLPNRALLSDRVRVALARRNKDDRDVTVLFVDLDGFKAVNDTMGHAAGDRMLVEVANRVNAIVRSTDTAARLGGDEFAVLLDGHDKAAALIVANRILDALSRPIRVDGAHERTIGASIGVVAVSTETGVDQVLRNADLAMYMAKAAGRGRVEVFEDAMFDEALDRADLERDLRASVAAGELTVSYQPCVELSDGTVTGLEALVRWTHPTRGPVPPNVFIPVAEATGLILDLGRQVLRTACHDAARLRVENPDLTMAVNVSGRQLVSPTFVGDVAAALRDSGLTGDALVLELTESILVHDVDLTITRLNDLKSLGVRLAIDDFGTGYSSLSYLRHFPIDILKIDRSFVEQLPGDGAALTRSIVRLGQSLKLEIVAEGVEDDAQRTELQRLGCARAQGFLFAEARPVSGIDALLRRAHVAEEWWRPAPPALHPLPSLPTQRAAGSIEAVEDGEPVLRQKVGERPS
jgi:diguanylate cyclase (GGDEF)-like protein